jgi:hypothetical protein
MVVWQYDLFLAGEGHALALMNDESFLNCRQRQR